jgi:DNA mismatch endonuclease (patch repair protein)
MDRLTKERRSWNMSRIRSRHTKPELIVRSVLHQLGFRFRLNHRSLPCRPDVVLTRYRTAVFVHGCFWHRHPGCQYAYTPKTNLPFWTKKFQANVSRDKGAMRSLRRMGWKTVVVWECQTTDRGALIRRLKTELAQVVRQSRYVPPARFNYPPLVHCRIG